MIAQARVTFSLHRFTLVAVGAMVLLGSVAALLVAWRLRTVGVTPECLSAWPRLPLDGSAPSACQQRASEFRSIDGAWAGPLMGALGGLPPLAGLLAGVALVAREIEDRTAPVAWSLAPSRTRWLIGRVVPVAALLTVLFAIAAIAGTELERARQPGIDPLLSFYNDSSRGMQLVAIGILVFTTAVFVGSILGRVLPALIMSSVVGLTLVFGVFLAESAWIPSQQLLVEFGDQSSYPGALGMDRAVVLRSGELRPSLDYGYEQDLNGNVIGLPDGARMVWRLVPGTRHPFVDAVVASLMAAIAAVMFLLTALVVRRRRPY
jgi:hypothetical protein